MKHLLGFVPTTAAEEQVFHYFLLWTNPNLIKSFIFILCLILYTTIVSFMFSFKNLPNIQYTYVSATRGYLASNVFNENISI